MTEGGWATSRFMNCRVWCAFLPNGMFVKKDTALKKPSSHKSWTVRSLKLLSVPSCHCKLLNCNAKSLR